MKKRVFIAAMTVLVMVIALTACDKKDSAEKTEIVSKEVKETAPKEPDRELPEGDLNEYFSNLLKNYKADMNKKNLTMDLNYLGMSMEVQIATDGDKMKLVFYFGAGKHDGSILLYVMGNDGTYLRTMVDDEKNWYKSSVAYTAKGGTFDELQREADMSKMAEIFETHSIMYKMEKIEDGILCDVVTCENKLSLGSEIYEIYIGRNSQEIQKIVGQNTATNQTVIISIEDIEGIELPDGAKKAKDASIAEMDSLVGEVLADIAKAALNDARK